MLTKSGCRVWRSHRLPVEHDRSAHAGDRASLRGIALWVDPHATMLDLRILEHLIEIVDRAGGHADGFELFEQVVALEVPRQLGQMINELLAVVQPVLVDKV